MKRREPPTPEQKRRCYRCLWLINHPFHDDGTVNEEADMEEFEMPDFHRGEDGKVLG